MVRGAPSDQERAVARAVELGINYFDTAAAYGDGASESNLGRVLAALRPDVLVASKARIEADSGQGIRETLLRSADASLQRLRRDRIDVFQLHTPVSLAGSGDTIAVAAFVDDVVPAFETLRRQGKIRFFGFNALGESAATRRIIDTGAIDTIQMVYNLLNPSAGAPMPSGAEGQDFERLLDRAQAASMGAIGIRALAAGALSGSDDRHPLGPADVAPMGTGADYRTDVRRARGFLPLVRDGHVDDLVEAALRFTISHPAIATVLVGFSDLAQIERAAAAVDKGPLPPATLDAIAHLAR